MSAAPPRARSWLPLPVLVTGLVLFAATSTADAAAHAASAEPRLQANAAGGPVGNFSAALNRLVALVGATGGAVLALVWTRVALSWFSNDVSKKVQAKDRARDALVGTLVFTAAISGLVWALAQWVVTGT